jgi:predicted ABC-type sugar transport system permease subunit
MGRPALDLDSKTAVVIGGTSAMKESGGILGIL